MRRVVLVTGPPCAGKTTHVRQHAAPGDLVLDQDVLGRTAMARAIAQLPHHHGTAWVIRCAPGPRARRHLAQQLGATEHVHLVEPEPVIIQRAAHRPNPRRHIAAVAKWYAVERANPAPRTPRASKPRGSTTERGYGWGHQQARAQAIKDMADGQPCARCGQPMSAATKHTLHYDHNDNRHGYRGLSHPWCNTRAGQAKAMANRRAAPQQAKAQPTPRSRSW